MTDRVGICERHRRQRGPANKVMTVTGPVAKEATGAIDAHGHVWIRPVALQMFPRLDDYPRIVQELRLYRESGGAGIVDCQPGSAGRDAGTLVSLARDSGLSIVASTGFHLPKYYAFPSWMWSASVEDLTSHMINELSDGMCDQPDWESAPPALQGARPRAGVIKAAFPGHFRDPRVCRLFEASTTACRQTGAALAIHTEQGAGVEQLVEYLDDRCEARRVVLCHLDKRPDAVLHRSLAQEGFLLEYDTFAVPKYHPDERVWPLLEHMISNDFSSSIACGLDLADASQWAFSSSRQGLCELTKSILPRLRSMGASSSVVHALTGQNIWSRLAVRSVKARVSRADSSCQGEAG